MIIATTAPDWLGIGRRGRVENHEKQPQIHQVGMTIPSAVADLSGGQGTGSPYKPRLFEDECCSVAPWFSGRTLARVGCLTKDRREKGQGVPKPARIAALSFLSKPPGHLPPPGRAWTEPGRAARLPGYYVLCRKGSQQSASYTPHIRGGPPGSPLVARDVARRGTVVQRRFTCRRAGKETTETNLVL